MKIGEKIKELRIENNLTQEQLADYLFVSYQAVSKWETGVSNPDLSLIAPLTKLFRISADELLGLNEKDKRRIELEEKIRNLRGMIFESVNGLLELNETEAEEPHIEFAETIKRLREMIIEIFEETDKYLLFYNVLDIELHSAAQCFFENNLNVSETARKLFVHRNTLIYRLERIRTLTGFDLREFDQAVNFKTIFMAKKHFV